MIQPQSRNVKDCQQPTEVRKRQGRVFLWSLWRGYGCIDILAF